MRSCIWIIAALALLGAVPAAKIQSMIAKPTVLCGRFDQTKQLVGLKKPVKSSGRFCIVADKGVLWRSERPFANTIKLTRDEIVQLQGERVAMRLETKKEPTVRMINSVLFALLAGDLDQLEKLFEIDGDVNHQSWHVTLKPRTAALERAIGAITLDGAEYVKNIAINESSGDRTSIVFSAIQTGEGAMTVDEAALF
jgi:Outer membrane lipoprotein carrier protein LolA-like